MADAPLVDGEDWQEFSDHRLISALSDQIDTYDSVSNKIIEMTETNCNGSVVLKSQNNCDVLNKTKNYLEEPEAVKLITESLKHIICQNDFSPPSEIASFESLLNESRMWSKVLESYEGVQPVVWMSSYIGQLQKQALQVSQIVNDSTNQGSAAVVDLPDDEELEQAMDLHSLILTSRSNAEYDDDQPVLTADQVISEIEEMMQDNTEEDYRTLDGPSKTAELVRLRLRQPLPAGTSIKECLESLSLGDLIALHDELDNTITVYSDVLIDELALREDISFNKESNNQFISLLLSIQRKRKELEAERRKGGASKQPQTSTASPSNKKSPAADKSTNSSPSGTYLTTVIPYDHHEGVPDSDRLQIYIKIMTAIDNDSPTVPALLTDYILKELVTLSILESGI